MIDWILPTLATLCMSARRRHEVALIMRYSCQLGHCSGGQIFSITKVK